MSPLTVLGVERLPGFEHVTCHCWVVPDAHALLRHTQIMSGFLCQSPCSRILPAAWGNMSLFEWTHQKYLLAFQTLQKVPRYPQPDGKSVTAHPMYHPMESRAVPHCNPEHQSPVVYLMSNAIDISHLPSGPIINLNMPKKDPFTNGAHHLCILFCISFNHGCLLGWNLVESLMSQFVGTGCTILRPPPVLSSIVKYRKSLY